MFSAGTETLKLLHEPTGLQCDLCGHGDDVCDWTKRKKCKGKTIGEGKLCQPCDSYFAFITKTDGVNKTF